MFDTTTAIWMWGIMVVTFTVAELLTAGFYILPFAVGALAAGIVAAAGGTIPLQLVAFTIGSGVALLVIRVFMRTQDTKPNLKIGAEMLIGTSGSVLDVDEDGTTGSVKTGSETWKARLTENHQHRTLTKGDKIKVTGHSSNFLLVEPIEPGPDK